MSEFNNKPGPSMELIVEKLDGLCTQVKAIEIIVNAIKDKQIKSDLELASLITPPNVEHRVREYVDQKDDHRKANITQALVQVQTIVTQGQEIVQLKLEAQIKDVALAQRQTESSRASDHTDMVKYQEHQDSEMDKVKKYIWMGLGGLAVLTTVLKFIGGH